MNKPFPRCYWVVPGLFLAGAYPGSKIHERSTEKLKSLLDVGIHTIINLVEENEKNSHDAILTAYYGSIKEIIGNFPQKHYKLNYLRIPVPDLNVPSKDTMKFILNIIDYSLAQNLPIYVHCWGGIGRTGTVVGCWLMKHNLANSDNVINYISELRTKYEDPEAARQSPETDEQCNFIKTWNNENTVQFDFKSSI